MKPQRLGGHWIRHHDEQLARQANDRALRAEIPRHYLRDLPRANRVCFPASDTFDVDASLAPFFTAGIVNQVCDLLHSVDADQDQFGMSPVA